MTDQPKRTISPEEFIELAGKAHRLARETGGSDQAHFDRLKEAHYEAKKSTKGKKGKK